MRRKFLYLVFCSIIATTSFSLADDPDSKGTDESAQTRSTQTQSKPDSHRVKIFVQPKSVSLFDWKARQKITLGVQMTSDKATRVVGLATDVRLIASKSRDNRVELLLAVTEQEKTAILSAAKLSEFWFVAMPFKPEHKQAFEKDIRFADFLKKNENYRPYAQREWGVGAKGEPIAAPSADEIHAIRKADLQEDKEN